MSPLPIEIFGRKLIRSLDLDPVYVGLVRANLPPKQLRKWLVAYWCFYSCGVASWLSEHKGYEFWDQMMIAAVNKKPTTINTRWPRAAERRHFRGAAAVDAVASLRNKYEGFPSAMVEYIIGTKPPPLVFTDVLQRAKEHKCFGPWIGFKIADMIDRCLGIKVDFKDSDVFMFDSPSKAAALVYEERKPPGGTVMWLIKEFSDLKAPPFFDRRINIQEIETVLCKWHSHAHGKYEVGKDIYEVRHALNQWTNVSKTAARILKVMPKEVA